jgi:hypothetical protein
MSRVLLFNPRSANYKPRIPNSILSIASSIEGIYDYVIVDGNLEDDPWKKIHAYLNEGGFSYFGITSMPGPQLKQAIPFSKKTRELFPNIKIIWGGYFPTQHWDVSSWSSLQILPFRRYRLVPHVFGLPPASER